MRRQIGLDTEFRFRRFNQLIVPLLAVGAIFSIASRKAHAQTPVPQSDSSFIDTDGTAHVARVVPVPNTISREAQKALARSIPDRAVSESIEDHRKETDEWQSKTAAQSRVDYPVQSISSSVIAGVPVRVILPTTIPDPNRERVLINLHGGGFTTDAGSLTESIPVANLTQTKVIAVLYRLSPESPFPAAVDDAVAVYRELLKTYKPQHIGVYGTSAGAILTAEVAVKLRQLDLALPGALGIFSGMGDFSRKGDSSAMYALYGLSGHLEPPNGARTLDAYVGNTRMDDPVLSPLYADLRGLPPTLFVTSTRDLLLSGTTILHRAFLGAGVNARLVVFEALTHAFWNDSTLPESHEANKIIADFFEKELN